jgi:hypothetical protein
MTSKIKITMREWSSISEHDRSWSGLIEENFMNSQARLRKRLEDAASKMSRDEFLKWYDWEGFDDEPGLRVEWVGD